MASKKTNKFVVNVESVKTSDVELILENNVDGSISLIARTDDDDSTIVTINPNGTVEFREDELDYVGLRVGFAEDRNESPCGG